MSAKEVRKDAIGMPTFCVEFNTAETQYATGHTKDIKVWSSKQAKCVAELKAAHTADISCMRYTGNGNIIASSGRDNTVKLWDVRTWK